jgi:CheY-like chemotaxis protein/anti-sigma regulatory factor (Ser/Thr protein kinase)/HPt (histidine-containing phosphotransfer) domain-containing protein
MRAPRRRDDIENDQTDHAPARTPPAGAPVSATASAAAAVPLRILVVDDCEANSHLAATMLAKLGALHATAASGREALDRLGTEAFDAVLMDCGLPDIDGFEATRRIRAGEAGGAQRDIPIVAFTADSDEETLRRCRDAGMERTLSKPLTIASLQYLLAELAGTRRPIEVGDHEGKTAVADTSASAVADDGIEPAFDAIGLLERVQQDESVAREALDEFLKSLSSQLVALQRAIGDAACQRSAALAHQLKGGAGGIGGIGLQRLARDIEAAGHGGNIALMRSLGATLPQRADAFRTAASQVDLRAVASSRFPVPARPTAALRDRSVLIVEDDPTLRMMLQRIAEREGSRVLIAESVAAAKRVLELYGSAAVDCVLSDYRMPEETGLDLLAWIRSHDPHVAVIMMTADDERSIVTYSMRKGACDFLEKPIDARRLIRAISSAAEQTLERRSMRRAQTEVAAVGATQARMLEARAETALPVDVVFQPKLQAGGDFFSQYPLGPDRTFCLLTDVSGHDLQAAYLSAYFHGMSRGMLACKAPPGAIFERCNRFLLEDWNRSNASVGGARSQASVAVTSLLIDRKAGTIETITAGAPAPSRVFADGRIAVVGSRGGAPLGWFDHCPTAEHSSSISGGGALLVWTDGLDELAQTANACVLAAAFALLRSQRKGEAHPLISTAQDDILVARIGLERDIALEDAFAPLVLWRYRGDEAPQIDAMAEYWRRSLRLAIPDLSDSAEHDILLATREAMLNALHHGCGGDPDLRVALHMSYHPSKGLVRVIVEDPGPGHGFDPAAYAESTADELVTEHRGLMFIHFLASEVRSLRNGATLEMDFNLRR